ncbi:hypothetical protein DRQ53_08845 [bacterium]|nr:MAG: hypothetical protein DRQ53_08845 [bacterium]
MARFLTAIALTLLLLPVAATQAAALNFGGQLVYGDDADVGIGGRLEVPTPDLHEDTRLEADFNWYFPEDPPGGDTSFWEINLNWLSNVGDPTGEARFHIGGGLNLARASVDFDGGGDDSSTDLGVNFLGGAVVPVGVLDLLAEVRITIGGSEQYTIGVGVLF